MKTILAIAVLLCGGLALIIGILIVAGYTAAREENGQEPLSDKIVRLGEAIYYKLHKKDTEEEK